MRLIAKYTIALAVVAAVLLSLLAYLRVRYIGRELEHDMARDQRAVGHILQAGVVDVWLDQEGRPRGADVATKETLALVARSNLAVGAARFDWVAGGHPAESQRFEGTDFVSRFPVNIEGTDVGTVVAREPRRELDRVVRADVLFSIAGIVTIIVVGLIASLVMRTMSAASQALAAAQAKSASETEARLRTVEQLRHQDRLSTVGKLAAGIAHELGTPLSIVGGHAQMIAGSEVSGDAALASARAIDHEATRMGKIVRQLLDFARRKGPEGTSCLPAEVARRCTSLLAVMAERNHVACEVTDASDGGKAMVDEDSLQQVLTNLIVNGIQAMPSGGQLAVTIQRAAATAEHPPAIRIDVGDTGTGIPADAMAHVFEPFFTTKASGDGTGLGLAVVQGIVVDHRGWITLDTSKHGTTVSVFLQAVA